MLKVTDIVPYLAARRTVPRPSADAPEALIMLLRGPGGVFAGGVAMPAAPVPFMLDAEMERLAPARGVMVGFALSAAMGAAGLGLRWLAG